MTLSSELLPAPLGPMIALISCSRTSSEMSLSALTPPKASDTPSRRRTESPIARTAVMRRWRSSRRLGRAGGERLRLGDLQVSGNDAGAGVLELHLGLDVLHGPARIERVDQRRVLFGDEAAANLARARHLVVVGIELLVQYQEALHLRIGERAFLRELGVHLLDALADQSLDFRLGG